MATPQTGIFAIGTSSHAYLELDVAAGMSTAAAVERVASLREPRTTIGGVNLVAGFRPELWAAVAPSATPPGVAGFDEAIVGVNGSILPATQHDIVIWLTGASYDVVFDLSRAVVMSLSDTAVLENEIVGWPYHHDLDLTGFIDGTENPSLVEATTVAIVPDGAPGAGSSVLLLQQWEHDAIGWEAMSIEAQEDIIGRRKADSEELSAAGRPTARSSTPSRRRRMSHAPTRTRSGRSSDATSRTGRCATTARSSSASVGSSGPSRRCSTA